MTSAKNKEFLQKVYNLRETSSDFSAYYENITSIEEFQNLVSKLEIIGKETAKYMGLLESKNKKEDENLSLSEIKWKRYFQDHQFHTTEDQRNIADLVSLLQNIDTNRFIKISRKSKAQFPAYSCIVPLAQLGGHNYKLGASIVNTSVGNVFYTSRGSTGNVMSTDVSTFRIANRVEIVDLIASMLYRNPSLCDIFVYDVLDDSGMGLPIDDEDNDEEMEIHDEE